MKYNNKDDVFLLDLKRFEKTFFANKKKTGDYRLYIKASILTVLFFGLYVSLLVETHRYLPLLRCALFGVVTAEIGFCIMHDASHLSFSSRKWVNRLMVILVEFFAGVSALLWRVKHVILHHSHTNTIHDDDINTYPLLRQHWEQIRRWFHRYQQWYAWLFYPLIHLWWTWVGDILEYTNGKVHIKKVKKERWDWVIFVSGKVFYFSFIILLPSFIVGWKLALSGYAIYEIACGYLIAVVFQLAHVVETSVFPSGDAKNFINAPWAVLQAQETSDFAPKSRLANELTGGLKHQVIHHLFPGVSHVHYPAMYQGVKEIFKKHGVKYNEQSFLRAVVSHWKTLRTFGVYDTPPRRIK